MKRAKQMPKPPHRGFSPTGKALARWFKRRSPGEVLPCLTILLSLDRELPYKRLKKVGWDETPCADDILVVTSDAEYEERLLRMDDEPRGKCEAAMAQVLNLDDGDR